jgi:hypothetical protein
MIVSDVRLSSRPHFIPNKGNNFVLLGRGGPWLLKDLLLAERLNFDHCEGCNGLIAFEPQETPKRLCANCDPAAGRKHLPGLRLVSKR